MPCPYWGMEAAAPSPEILKACKSAGQNYRERAVREAASAYDRQRHLSRIVPLSPETIADTSLQGTKRIVERLEETSRGLAQAGSARHWTYDTNRHITVLGALQSERATLAHLEEQQDANDKAAA